MIKAVVKYVGGFWPIGVFFSGYGSFFLFLDDKLRRKRLLVSTRIPKSREFYCNVIVQQRRQQQCSGIEVVLT